MLNRKSPIDTTVHVQIDSPEWTTQIPCDSQVRYERPSSSGLILCKFVNINMEVLPPRYQISTDIVFVPYHR